MIEPVRCCCVFSGGLVGQARGMHQWVRQRWGRTQHACAYIQTIPSDRHNNLSQSWRWALLAAIFALLLCWAEAAGSQADVLRAGSGMRANEKQGHHLTRKATCSGQFLGQSPLFKGEWVPHEVGSISTIATCCLA